MTRFAAFFLVAFIAGTALAEKPIVRVATVDELYAAVNDPLNAGVRIELAAGTYILAPTDRFGAARPNDGTLLLQPNIELAGQQEYQDVDGDGVWDPLPGSGPDAFVMPGTETKIESRMLNPPVVKLSDCNPSPRTNTVDFMFPVIQTGRRNRVERLTVSDGSARKTLPLIGPPFHDPSLALGSGWDSEVIDSVLEGGSRGAVFSNAGCGAVGFVSRVTVERNVIRHNRGGIFMLNFLMDNPAGQGASFHGLFRQNRFYGNGDDAALGLTAGGYGADNSELHVRSIGNIFDANALGVSITGGSDNATNSGGNGNRFLFTSDGDTIRNNGPRAGLVVHGAHRTQSTAGTSSNNEVRVELIGTGFAANSFLGIRRDIVMMAAIGSAQLVPGASDFFPGEGNVVRALVRGATGDGTATTFLIVDGSVAEPSNRVIVLGSRIAFERTNWAIDSPDDEFFSPRW